MSEVTLTRREQQALRKAALGAAPVRTLRDIGSALEPSTIPNVMKLKSNIVCVFASEWELCKQEIEEQCCVKWIISRPNRHSSAVDITKKKRVLFSQVYSCHRGESYEPESREKRPIQRKSKKVGCEATLIITCHADKPHVYMFDFIGNHKNHIPGDIQTDLGLIPLTRGRVNDIVARLTASPGSSARKIRLEILRDVDRQEYSLNERKINYFDIYNKILAINRTIFRLHEDDFKSMKMWFAEKLSPKNFIIFEGNLQAYTNDESLYACGFASPFQQGKIKAATTFCMDATYIITQRSDDILYTIVIRDEELDRGFPCAYMLTNDHSLGPIVQWLKHLKDNQLIVNPHNAETNALAAIFPGCQIQYCLFHVSQEWYRQLNLKVKTGSTVNENRLIRGEIMAFLKHIMYEEHIVAFLNKIVGVIEKYEHTQPDFVKYFETNWCTMAKYCVWSRAFHQLECFHMLTNNYIESWHNQLKTRFLGRSRNKRFDRPIFILTNEVEFYFKEEAMRINMRSSPMTAAQKQQRKIEMSAEAVPPYMRANMIVSPSKAASLTSISDDTDDVPEDGFWFIDSFTEDGITYQVEVNNSVILSCTCYSWARYMKPCKHMHLLRIHVSGFTFPSVPFAVNNMLSVSISIEQFVEQNSMTIGSRTETTGRGYAIEAFEYTKKCSLTTRHNEQDLYQLIQYATEEEAEAIRAAYAAPIKAFQAVKAKYETHFRTLTTQRP
ncbi:hypothetical protein PHYBLDRAFT_164161 [Phycomyces blakesleeanus NRRL 1555(-)]|uniref:SWIM-type domain-containing protein n=1 Tax=Phycomyces blakesleeanus (strain ATCC 8743b / DSM 1359 / FGSC 10004 / NBRC 33097 / NRRL 1555) TaxID=763407 RepID=A0A167P4W0_PHYB8|nr:hypothetical protein PHYBLDRAFT_164161 [Phycomyces blakesleeanus NRRL 1555(-)]OAD77249.1 hypothetical protein PHYBLDRAFT_164161 [Phycomyces blakesleeanus NRRL 1555(-)]|eukprot:XP_018295289.1 hypothetical protein PHYBLDRAFT_164161 [Phycomyces blakesleeanus NRRL 1555(-)]